MNTPTILQFPNGEEKTTEEWKEEPVNLKEERDKFLLWEVRRNLFPTIAKLMSTQGGRHEH